MFMVKPPTSPRLMHPFRSLASKDIARSDIMKLKISWSAMLKQLLNEFTKNNRVRRTGLEMCVYVIEYNTGFTGSLSKTQE